ncbi:outer membrane channel protein [bacterium BMS3Abin04]|nr:outer membrane channel protein [bacterium BMS3Abin04]
MNSRLLMLLIIFLSFVGLQFGQEKNESLQDLITEATKVSPRIKMLQSKFDLAKSNIEIGTNLPDPVLTLGLVNMPTNSFSFTQEPMTGKIVGLSQAIPFPGALSSASNVKAVDTSIVGQETLDLQNKIREDVSDLYYSIQVIREEIKLSRESIQLLNQISNVVKRKYEVGNASLQNIIQVEVQITRVKDKLESLKGKERSAIAKLNALLLRRENSTILTGKITPIISYNVKSDSLLKIARLNRPLLQKIKFGELKAQFMKEQAEYSFYPNFKLGLQYSQRDYSAKTGTNFTDFLSVVVGVTIPINYGGNKTEKVNKAIHLQSFYNNQYNSALQDLQHSFGNINGKISELENREILITKSLLPQAEQSYKASIADYQVGKIDFVNVIKAENDILNIKTELAKVRVDYSKSISQLEYLSGKQLTSIE